MLGRLNGWQRLWIIASAAWIGAVGYIEWDQFPTRDRLLWPAQSAQLKLTEKTLDEASEILDKCARANGGRCPQEQMGPYTQTVAEGRRLGDEIVSDAMKRIDGSLVETQIRAGFVVVAEALLPAVGLYVAGLLAAWVRRGFRSQATS